MYTPVEQRKKIVKQKSFSKSEKKQITIETVKGVLGWTKPEDNPYLKVAKDIAQGIARTVASVGISAGNIPSKIKSQRPTFKEEIPTQETKLGRAIFGETPVRTVEERVRRTKEQIKPYIGEKISQKVAFPLVGLGIAMDLSGFGGGKVVKKMTEIPEQFWKVIGKEKNATKIEGILTSIGLDKKNARSLSETFAPLSKTEDLKNALVSYKPVSERIPLSEIIKKEPVYYHGTNNGKEIVKQGFNLSKLGDNSGYKGIMGNGIYLDMTPNAEGAKLYGKDILEVKPKSGLKLFEWSGKVSDLYHEKTGYGTPEKITEYLQSQGYDGVKLNNQQMVIFNPKNIEKVKISGQGTGELSQIKESEIKPVKKEPLQNETIKWIDNWVSGSNKKPSLKVEQQLSKYKGNKPVTLYRAVIKGKEKTNEIESWSYSKDGAEFHADVGFPENAEYTIIEKQFNPEDIIFDSRHLSEDELSSFSENALRYLETENEVIVRNNKIKIPKTGNEVKESPIDIKFQSKIKNKEYLKKNFEDEDLKIEDSGKKYVYHATNSKNIEEIKQEKFYRAQPKGEGLIKRGGGSMYGNAPHFSENLVTAKMYGDNIIEFGIKDGSNIKRFKGTYDLNKEVGEWAEKTKGAFYKNNTEGNQLIDDWAKANKVDILFVGQDGSIFNQNAIKRFDDNKSLFPTVIQGETFTMGPSTTTSPTLKGLKTELKATQKEIKNAQIAAEKAAKLDAKEQKVRTDALSKLNRYRGSTDTIEGELKNKNLSQEDIENIVLEDGTKLLDAAKIKRNNDGSLSTVITKKELEDIKASYTDEVPKQKWEKKSILVNAKEIPINLLKSIELPYSYFERKGLSSIYDQVIESQRDAELMKSRLIEKFKDAGLYKEGGWFTANRFNLSKNEAEGVSEYYLGHQGHGKEIPITDLSSNGQKFVKVFDEIINETTKPFYEVARRMGKNPGVVENYAPIMTRDDIKLVDQGGGQDWLFRKHPAFFSLKERVKRVPKEIYETDYRKVASRWLDGITQFITMGDTTNHLKYLINSDEFKSLIKEQDYSIVSNWLKDITTPQISGSLAGQATNDLSRLMRKGVALGSLGLNYATVLKQALTQIPITIIEKAPPKFKSKYAEAFGINVKDLPSISKRKGDIAISDLQGKIGSIFTGAITQFDKKNAQLAMNALLDKEYRKFLKQGDEITPEVRKVIEKTAQDKIDMWFGGFFKGQRPEAYRQELGNFILMFTYPLTSQANGFFRHMLKAKGFVGNIKAVAEVLGAVVGIAYMEKVIENLSPQWSDEKEMTKDILVSATGNIPMAGQIAYAIESGQDMNVSPVVGNINNIVRNISKGEGEKVAWNIAETIGLPKQIRRIREGLEIMEEGGVTDSNGKMMAPVQDTMEYIRAFLRGKYGPLASQDYIRNMGADAEDRRWFYPEVEFLQNAGSSKHPKDGSYKRRAEIYKTWDKQKQIEMRNFLSENQQKKLDKALQGKSTSSKGTKALSDIFK